MDCADAPLYENSAKAKLEFEMSINSTRYQTTDEVAEVNFAEIGRRAPATCEELVPDDLPLYENTDEAKQEFEVTETLDYRESQVPVEKKEKASEKRKQPRAKNSIILAFVLLLVIPGSICGLAALAFDINEWISEIMEAKNNTAFSTIDNKNDPSELEAIMESNLYLQGLDQLQNSSAIFQENVTEALSALQSRTAIFEEVLNNFQHLINNQSQEISDLKCKITQLNQSLERRGQYPSNPVCSCAALPPSSPSGYYWVSASNGSAVRVYCDMTRSCGGVTGGWMRVAELDMTNSSHQCPSGLRQRVYSNIRTCVSSSSLPSCSSSITFTTFNSFNRVCGSITGYQVGITNAFAAMTTSIDSYYVDGVSLTHGNPKQHIWTFAAARDETHEDHLDSKCSCILRDYTTDHSNQPPHFVGEHYFCDTGSSNEASSTSEFFSDVLWDGAGCGPTSECCGFNSPPWFYRQLPQPTTDNIEMRVCKNEDSTSEDIAINTIEIYIQ